MALTPVRLVLGDLLDPVYHTGQRSDSRGRYSYGLRLSASLRRLSLGLTGYGPCAPLA